MEDEVFQQDFENAERIACLVAGFIRGTLTPLEHKELDNSILVSEANEQLFDELTDQENVQKAMEWYASIDTEAAFQRLKKRISFRQENIYLYLFVLFFIGYLLPPCHFRDAIFVLKSCDFKLYYSK